MVSSALLGFIGWMFIPRYATQHALRIVLQVYPQISGRPSPPPGTSLYVKFYRYTYAAMILAYLVYSLIKGLYDMAPNFYEILGVAPDVDENGLKLAFRQFAKRYHPDRVGSQGAELFMQTRDVFEALKNPTTRWAYDRFGPDVLTWSHSSTPREYLQHGLLQSSGYHIVTALGLVVFSAVGQQSPVKFWRYVLFLMFFASELAYLLYPSPPSLSFLSSAFWDSEYEGPRPTILHLLFPRRVAYQHILFLHQLFFMLSVALTRVAPALFPDEHQDEQKMLLQHISQLAAFSDKEASMMLHTDLQSIHPFSPTSRVSTAQMQPMLEPDSDVMDALAEELKNMIIENNLKVKQLEIPPLRSVLETAVTRQRTASAPSLAIPKKDAEHSSSPSSACEGEGKLPSPRPSPPPSVRRNSSYVRARSVSWS